MEHSGQTYTFHACSDRCIAILPDVENGFADHTNNVSYCVSLPPNRQISFLGSVYTRNRICVCDRFDCGDIPVVSFAACNILVGVRKV
jgi:hypothetical protein